MPMTIKSFSDFFCTKERLNPKLGYTPENTRLVCHEFNQSTQTTAALMKQIFGF